ncbi:MAG: hypothetical protein HQL39_08670 [Alphaproteobacteria bacterium]|nr:hypothetical protein [Alphaproteobacteria bacterium]
MTSFYMDLTEPVLKIILSDSPYHSEFSAFQTKSISLEESKGDNGRDKQEKYGAAMTEFVNKLKEWRKDRPKPSAQIVYKAMNKAFSQFDLIKSKGKFGEGETLCSIRERFRRVLANSFSSFEKDVLAGDGVVALQNSGIGEIINSDWFKNDAVYKTNIAPLLDVDVSITKALLSHPLFDLRCGDVPLKSVGGQNPPWKAAKGNNAGQKVATMLRTFERKHRATLASATNQLEVVNVLKRLKSNQELSTNSSLINPNHTAYQRLLAAAKKFGLEGELEAWRKG